MNDQEDGDILKQLQAIQTLLDGVIKQLGDDIEEDDMEGPETEEMSAPTSLLARGR